MAEKGKKLISKLYAIYTDVESFGKDLYMSFNEIDKEDRETLQKILGYIQETNEKYYMRLNY